ncbi:MACPF domain-containing protein At1g14780-like [Silene latifolia]|uniref:MACPF domain-containing protein At1g14780-like n=1 Tax=Silene latifolia TaxID=37657 RepID=UPI003D788DD2
MRENGGEKLNMMMTISNWSVIETAIDSLGKGLDLTSDFRLKYCKGRVGERLVVLNDNHKRPLVLPGFGAFHEPVSIDIKCDKGDHTRHQSDILDFSQMSELLNRRSAVSGKIPSGLFNSMFKYESGSWAKDAANTKMLGIDGYSIVLFNLHIDRYPLILSDDLRNSVPSTWDPLALSRYLFLFILSSYSISLFNQLVSCM